MRLFGKRPAEAARPALARAFGGPRGGDWPMGYEAQVREAYLGNPVAQRAVRIVAEGAASVPVYAPGDDAARVETMIARAGLIEAVAAQLLLHGNAFVQIVGDAEGVPAALFALRPDRVSIETDAHGWPAAYVYRAGDRVTRVPAHDAGGRPGLVHLSALNPIDDHYGVGSLGAAAAAVAVHNAAARWNKALLDNAARPSGALVHDPGEAGAALSPEQYARLRAEMEAGFAGAANAGRPMLLEGGLRWQAMSLTPADMDFVGLKAGAAREIALAFGVPPMLLGLPGDNTYANYSEANRALWRMTIVPLVQKIIGGLVEALRAWWPALEIKPDLDQIPALVSDRAGLWAQVTAADFLTVAEKREMLGFRAEI
ncbi:phage portal protein [Sphingomonas bacterium]|uniref:phage portal protein n=1 Tax=Sphingomonas bacterium TaxID=1895847 RepID=UPI00157525FA|nr:phage portal protein [Sphingomonas bacterium]